MTKHRITFAELRQFLRDMQFKEDLFKGEFYRFKHDPSDTEFVFRHYKPMDLVNPGDLMAVRRFLDERGLMDADAFDRLLTKAPA
jgi:hypothetical protein